MIDFDDQPVHRLRPDEEPDVDDDLDAREWFEFAECGDLCEGCGRRHPTADCPVFAGGAA